MDKEELEKRTLDFSIQLVRLLKKLPKNQINQRVGGQLLDSGTSIGANYREANGAESPKDFQHKIGISFKESRETSYWLPILYSVNPEFGSEIKPLCTEADEFKRIFGAIYTTCKNKAKKNHNSQISNPK